MLNGNNPAELTAKEYRQLTAEYLAYLELGKRHFSNPKITAAQRLEKLRLLEKTKIV